MRRIAGVILCVILAMYCVSVSAEKTKYQYGTPEEVLGMTEAEMMEKVLELLKDDWLYGRTGNFRRYAERFDTKGYLQILHTQICYIDKNYADHETTEIKGKTRENRMFNVYCVVDFTMINDLYGTAPYYADLGEKNNVVIYWDGRMEVCSGVFYRYITQYAYEAFGEMFASVIQTDDYNRTYCLLEQE